MRKLYIELLVLGAMFIVSCSGGQSDFADCGIEVIDIPNPRDTTHVLTEDEYIIDSICPLEYPKDIGYFDVTKFMVKNGRTYIMDSKDQHTILVFDHQGHFLFKAGEQGRAKNEYIAGPTDFFVDNNNNLHVFDYDGQKIIVFNDKGNVDEVVSTREHIANSFGLTNDNRYMFAYNQNVIGAALTIDDENNKVQNTIIPMPEKYDFFYEPTQRLFFSNGNRLSHIPLLSDSILVFKNSSLEKVVRVDFHGEFVMNEIPEAVFDMDKSNKLDTYKGVRNIREYQETDSLQFIEYNCGAYAHLWLKDKNKKRIINSYTLFLNKSPLRYYYLLDNQIVSLSLPFYEREMNSNEKSCAKVFYIRLK